MPLLRRAVEKLTVGEVIADDEIPEGEADRSSDTSDFLEVVTRLRSVLGDFRGRIRVVDAQALAGLGRPSYYRMSLIARALRHLGWKRSRYRFEGVLTYAYAKGTRLQRENILDVERGEDKQLVVVKRRDP